MNRMRQSFPVSTASVICLIVFLAILTGGFFYSPRTTLAQTNTTQTAPVNATLQSNIDTLIHASDVVVRGRVEEQRSFWDADHAAILTDSQIRVLYDVIGSSSQTLTVRTLGGELPDEYIGMGVSHVPALYPGEDVAFYLQQEGDHFTVSQGEAGKFTVRGQDAFNARLMASVPLSDLFDATTVAATDQGRAATLPEDWRGQEAQAQLAPAAAMIYSYDGVHWPGDNPAVSFYVNPVSTQSGPDDGDQADFLNAIRAAAQTWTDVSSAAFTLAYAGTTTHQDVGLNGVNEVIFTDQGAEDGIVGRARYWYGLPSKELVEADIWFNDAFDFDATGSPGPSEIDLQSVALHEFGHWLVLGHDDDPAAIMHYAMTAGVVKRALHQNDIDGVSAIYPCPDNTCGPTPSPTNTPLPPTPTFTPIATSTPAPPTPTNTPGGTIPPTPTDSIQVEEASSQGGTIAYNDASGETALTLDIPPGAVEGTIFLIYTEIDAPLQPPVPDGQFAGRRFEVQAIQNGGLIEHYVFATPVIFTVAYPEQAGLNEESLTLFSFDETLQQWTSAACGDVRRDPTNNEISVAVCHLGEFALFDHQVQVGGRVLLPVVRR